MNNMSQNMLCQELPALMLKDAKLNPRVTQDTFQETPSLARLQRSRLKSYSPSLN